MKFQSNPTPSSVSSLIFNVQSASLGLQTSNLKLYTFLFHSVGEMVVSGKETGSARILLRSGFSFVYCDSGSK